MLTDEEAMELMAEDIAFDIPIKHESKPYFMIPFSDNATNGDVIKTMFPDDEGTPEFVYEDMVFYGKGNYDRTWWNAPYKKENEE